MKEGLEACTRVTADAEPGRKAVEIFRNEYDKAALTDEGAQSLNDHIGFAAYLEAGIRRFSAKITDYALARLILAGDFLTPEQVSAACRSITYSTEQIETLKRKLPPVAVFEWAKDNGCVVMPPPPFSMCFLEIRQIRPIYFARKREEWYVNQRAFHEEETSFKWMIMKKEPVRDSEERTWFDQINLLSSVELVPSAVEFSWFITTYFDVFGIRLFKRTYVRTSSGDATIGRIYVGGFDSEGLNIDYVYDSDRHDNVGLCASRRL